jgi:hypothetical protein
MIMFKNQQQRSNACRALLATRFDERTADYWNEGPTERAMEYATFGGGERDEIVLLRCALDFWKGEGGARLSEVLLILDSPQIVAVASLMLAHELGGCAVDEWIESMQRGDHLFGALSSFDAAVGVRP